MDIVWTKHAEERQKEWEKKLHITKEEVEAVVNKPEQVVKGDLSIKIAQAKIRSGLLRVPFLESASSIKIITLYWTSRIERYWKEE